MREPLATFQAAALFRSPHRAEALRLIHIFLPEGLSHSSPGQRPGKMPQPGCALKVAQQGIEQKGHVKIAEPLASKFRAGLLGDAL